MLTVSTQKTSWYECETEFTLRLIKLWCCACKTEEGLTDLVRLQSVLQPPDCCRHKWRGDNHEEDVCMLNELVHAASGPETLRNFEPLPGTRQF